MSEDEVNAEKLRRAALNDRVARTKRALIGKEGVSYSDTRTILGLNSDIWITKLVKDRWLRYATEAYQNGRKSVRPDGILRLLVIMAKPHTLPLRMDPDLQEELEKHRGEARDLVRELKKSA